MKNKNCSKYSLLPLPSIKCRFNSYITFYKISVRFSDQSTDKLLIWIKVTSVESKWSQNYTNAIWYSFQDGVVETILIEKDDTIKLENIEKVYDTYPPPDKNFKYEDPYVTDEEMRQLALERVIRMRVATSGLH